MKKCWKCGTENDDGASLCSSCGEYIGSVALPEDGASDTFALTNAFSSNLFLAICVLVTLSTLISFGLIQLLFAIFCWIIYSKAKSGSIDAQSMRSVSGTVYASRVICFVCGALMFVCAGIVLACALAIPAEAYEEFPNIQAEIIAELQTQELPKEVMDMTLKLLEFGLKNLFAVAIGWCAVFGAYLLCCGYIWGGIHKFTKELYAKAPLGESSIDSTSKGFACMIILGVVGAIGSLSSMSMSFKSALGAGLLAAATIIGAVFIKKNFAKK